MIDYGDDLKDAEKEGYQRGFYEGLVEAAKIVDIEAGGLGRSWLGLLAERIRNLIYSGPPDAVTSDRCPKCAKYHHPDSEQCGGLRVKQL